MIKASKNDVIKAAEKHRRTLRELAEAAAIKEAIRAEDYIKGRICPHCALRGLVSTDFIVEDTRDVRGGARNRTLRCRSCDKFSVSSEVVTKAL